MQRRAILKLAFALPFFAALPARAAFDHGHGDWNALLRKHVKLISDGKASQLDYAGIAAERPALDTYLAALSAVSVTEYRGWQRDERLAFLINAYNAFTVALILGKYPRLNSIRDLGSFLQSPWKKKFVRLLGEVRNLDDIEHDMIRAPGVFDEPRIHVAVVCASIGCPMLRNEAFVAARLKAQLEDSMRRFLSDRSRNRFDTASGKLEVSKIFDWYGEDFEKGWQGFDSLKATFARYAPQLADAAGDQARIRNGDYALEFLDYDWRLNDTRRPGK